MMYIPFVSPLEATTQSPPHWPQVVESPSDPDPNLDFDFDFDFDSNSLDVLTYGSHTP